MDETVIEYIKASLDALHIKVDTAFEKADVRLKSLEETRAHEKGFMRAVSLMSATVGVLCSGFVSYFVFKK